METYPVYDPKNGIMTAFEIDNVDNVDNSHRILPTVLRVLKKSPHVSEVRRRGFLSCLSDFLVRFNYHGKPFVVWQLSGGLPYYWIGPYNEEDSVNIQELERLFKNTDAALSNFGI